MRGLSGWRGRGRGVLSLWACKRRCTCGYHSMGSRMRAVLQNSSSLFLKFCMVSHHPPWAIIISHVFLPSPHFSNSYEFLIAISVCLNHSHPMLFTTSLHFLVASIIFLVMSYHVFFFFLFFHIPLAIYKYLWHDNDNIFFSFLFLSIVD